MGMGFRREIYSGWPGAVWILRVAGICFFREKDTFRVREHIKSPLFFYCLFREVLYNYNHYAEDMEDA